MPSIVLVHPEIPHNTGAIGRTCVALDCELVLIRPYGFYLTDRHLQRAGLDYWRHVRLAEYAGWDAFIADRRPRDDQLFLFEEFGAASVFDVAFPEDAFLVFGSETAGLPPPVLAAHPGRTVRLPMRSGQVRSLNLANAVTAAAYQAMRGSLEGR